MRKSFFNNKTGYLIYIAANKKREVVVGIKRSYELISVTESSQYPRLVYFKNYKEKKNAVSKMKKLAAYSSDKLFSFVTEHNPEWLNLIRLFDED
ncbi:MAG TPA: hypothetical protein PKD83_07640 [Ignavibacteria bacterium]|nr:hypothetical protein [Ignavibacteria bacterium]